jgi:hypothetical protein
MPSFPGSGLPHEPSYDDSEEDVVVDRVTGLMWQATHSEESLTRQEAIDYCAALEIAESCDFRIPSLIEVLSLADPSQISRTPGPFVDGADPTLAWAPGEGVWVVGTNFGYGLRSPEELELVPQSVRCVRPHFEYNTGHERFLVEGDSGQEAIVQPATGLKWEKVSEVPRLGLEEARAYCEGLTLDGGGFRLAGAKELITLLDHVVAGPLLIDLDLFPMTGDTENDGRRAWTDTSNLTEWVVDLGDGTAFNYGDTITYRADSELRVFCVK